MEVTSHHLAAGARSENLPFCVTVMYSDILAKSNTTIEEEVVERKKLPSALNMMESGDN